VITFKRKRKTKDPCERCQLHRELCLCDDIPTLKFRTRVSLVIHRKELKRTTNTGRLALEALTNSCIRIRGGLDCSRLDLSDLIVPEYRSVLFFPAEDAVELNHEFVSQSSLPIQLIVPDGNWRQASKLQTRHPELASIPRVKISTANCGPFHLRKEHLAEGMSTLQAIARALAIIEGPTAAAPLEKLYHEKLQRTLRGRGACAEPLL